MSISLMGVMVGLPIALAMRGVMGKQKFEQWLESSDYILYTNFMSMDEMKKTVCKAGYDVSKWGDSFKTHLSHEKSSYFLWKRKNGKIVAVMSIYDDKQSINTFISKVERVAGSTVFYEENGIVEKKKNITSEKETIPKNKENYPTVYTDAELLIEVLKRCQIEILSYEDNKIETVYDCYNMTFSRNSSEDPFDIDIVSENNRMKELYNCIDIINTEYFASVQEKTYLTIKEQILEEGMEIEDEQVLEDNSICLTIQV